MGSEFVMDEPEWTGRNHTMSNGIYQLGVNSIPLKDIKSIGLTDDGLSMEVIWNTSGRFSLLLDLFSGIELMQVFTDWTRNRILKKT